MIYPQGVWVRAGSLFEPRAMEGMHYVERSQCSADVSDVLAWIFCLELSSRTIPADLATNVWMGVDCQAAWPRSLGGCLYGPDRFGHMGPAFPHKRRGAPRWPPAKLGGWTASQAPCQRLWRKGKGCLPRSVLNPGLSCKSNWVGHSALALSTGHV